MSFYIYLNFIVLTFATALGVALPAEAGIAPFIVFLVFCLQLMRIRQGIRDPLLVFCLSTFLYGFVPHFADLQSDELVQNFGSAGGHIIYCYAVHALVLAYIVSEFALPSGPRLSPEVLQGRERSNDKIVIVGFILCAVVSLGLESVYYGMHGAVIGGDIEYDQGFRERTVAGSGVLLLSYPIGVAGLCMMLTSRYRYKVYSYFIAMAPFVLLYIVHGERKYFVAPALAIAGQFLTIKKVSSIIGGFVAAAIGWVVFSYMGYLRLYGYKFSEALNEGAITGYLNEFSYQIGGETPGLFGTASAAYEGFIQPLPYLGDYLLAWKIVLPQFIFGAGVFEPTSLRFARVFAADRAADGMGWGFSFWGEAYLVMGVPGIYLMAIVIALIFRAIRRHALKYNLTGPIAAWFLMGLYQAFWLSRIDFAFFLKDYLVVNLVIVTVFYKLAESVQTFSTISRSLSSRLSR